SILLLANDLGMLRLGRGETQWTIQSNGLPPNTEFTGMEVLSNGRLYMSTNGPGVYYSTDGGANWQGTNRSLVNARVKTMGSVGNILLVNVRGRLYRLDDNGVDWSKCAAAGGAKSWLGAIATSRAGDVYVGDGIGNIIRSSDRGETWTDCEQITPYDVNVATLAVDAQD